MVEQTNTGETLLKLQEFRNEINEKIEKTEIVNFKMHNIEIGNETMSYDGNELTENAKYQILKDLRVRNSFMDFSKEMTISDWNTVKDKLTCAPKNDIYARIIDDNGTKKVDDIRSANIKNTGSISMNLIFQKLIDSIVSSSKDLILRNASFVEKNYEIIVQLVENANEIDIFGNQKDVWKTGTQITWNGLKFQIAPFAERLVCTNGMTANQYGYKSNVSNKKFNIGKIEKMLEKEIVLESNTMDLVIMDAAKHLSSINASVNEFLLLRNLFDEENHSEIIEKYFDEKRIDKAYNALVSEKPNRWQMTADSGRNAYELFNDMTYIASHFDDTVFNLSESERFELQRLASGFFFKEKMDLELVAPKVIFS